jgi:hypothetical protein
MTKVTKKDESKRKFVRQEGTTPIVLTFQLQRESCTCLQTRSPYFFHLFVGFDLVMLVDQSGDVMSRTEGW